MHERRAIHSSSLYVSLPSLTPGSKLEKKLENEVSDHHKLTKLETEATGLRSKLALLEQEHDECMPI